MPKPVTRHNVAPVSLFIIALLVLGLRSHPAVAADAVNQTAAQTDWKHGGSLTQEQQRSLKASCDGAYIDPFANAAKPDPANTLIEVDAGSADMNYTHIELGDGVVVTQGPRSISAQSMVFDKTTEQAEMSGGVEIRQRGSLILGETAQVNMVANHASFTDGSFLAHEEHMRGTARKIAHEASGKLVLEQGTFTSCEPDDNAWLLSGKELTLDPETQQGTGRKIVVRIGGIPVLYTPYIRFPIGGKRQTGLLTPTVGTYNSGIDYTQPWYWNIAPNQDATIAPRYVSGRGGMLEAEYRYWGRSSRNIFQFSGLPNDKGGNDPAVDQLLATGAYDEDTLRPHKGNSRWLVQLDHQGGIQRPWYSDIEFGKVSDVDYLRDLPAESFSVANETYLTQSASFGIDLTNWHLSGNVYNAQNLLSDIDDAYRRLPQLIADGNYRWGDFGVKLNHEYVNFGHRQDERISGKTLITGERARLDYQLSYQKDTTWGFVNPSIGAQGIAYKLESAQLKDGADAAPNLTTHYASLDSGLVFEHESGLQTIEPRLFYLFRNFADHSDLFNVTDDGQNVNFDTSPLTFSYHQLFRPHRFAGGDRLDDANQLTIGLTHNLFRQDGSPLWDLSLGQTFYFEDRKVGLNGQEETTAESDIAGQFNVYATDYLRALGSGQFNPEANKLMRANIGLHYDQSDWLFNLDYRYAREQQLTTGGLSQEIDQVDLSFYVPTSDQWRLVGRTFYDLDEQRELEVYAGFEYSSCCYRIRTVARRWLDSNLALSADSDDRPYDEGILFEVELIGLGSSGERIEKLFEDGIFGYKSRR